MRPLTPTHLHIYHPPAPACFHAGEQTLSATHELIAKPREPSRVEGLGEEVREVVVGVHLVNLARLFDIRYACSRLSQITDPRDVVM